AVHRLRRDALADWMTTEIKEGDVIGFTAITPLNDQTIAKHLAHSRTLGLPEADGEPLRCLNIVANGPSAKGLTFDGPCMALNGAHSLFTKDNSPAFWAGCDPQAHLADMIVEPFAEKTYIVAAKCHPRVFETLRGHDVRL